MLIPGAKARAMFWYRRRSSRTTTAVSAIGVGFIASFLGSGIRPNTRMRTESWPGRLWSSGSAARSGAGPHAFGVHLGAMLSGAARIGSSHYRDELVRNVPAGEDPIVGGEMEGVGLLAASTASDDPVWCVVKGISDFADKDRHKVVKANRRVACRNAAEFLLSALLNDAAG